MTPEQWQQRQQPTSRDESPPVHDSIPSAPAVVSPVQLPVDQPAVAESPAPAEQPAFALPVSSRHTRSKLAVGLGVAIAVIVLGAGSVYAYVYHQAHVSAAKFNALATQIKQQELAGAKNYVAAGAVIDDFNTLMTQATDASAGKNAQATINAKAATLQAIVDKSCQAKSTDLTPASIDEKTHGLRLTTTQQHYIADMKTVIGGLEKTDYSNAGVCHDGPALVGVIKNMANLLPGLSAMGGADTMNDEAAINAELQTLKPITTMKIVDEDAIKSVLPETANFLEKIQTVLSDVYFVLDANDRHDTATLNKYGDRFTTDLQDFSDASTSSDKEITALDKQENDAATAASQAEIAAIKYQKQHRSTTAAMQLDTTLPSFRIVDSAITNYSDAHDSSFPHGSSIDDIADMNDDIKQLKNQDYLQNINYTVLGNDASGFSLEAKLQNGTTLSEKVDPASLSV